MSDSEAASDPHAKLYELCREKIKFENELTNHRLNWNFAVQAFLLGAFGLCLQTMSNLNIKLADKICDSGALIALRSSVREARLILQLIGYSVIIVSVLIVLATLGAQIAIYSNVKYLHGHYPEYKLDWPRKWHSHGKHRPGILGGGNPLANLLGMAPLLIPVLSTVAWWLLVRHIP